MAYATVQDMVTRYGERELIRLSAGDGELPETVTEAPVLLALDDATAQVESYLRRRYVLPLVSPTADVVRVVCALARFHLATGGDRTPSTDMRTDRNDAIAWLNKLADGTVTLEGAAPVSVAGSAMASDRPVMFGHNQLRGW